MRTLSLLVLSCRGSNVENRFDIDILVLCRILHIDAQELRLNCSVGLKIILTTNIIIIIIIVKMHSKQLF